MTPAERAAREATALRGDTGYGQVEADYIDALRAELGTSVTMTKKWPDEDLLWPHSDLDLRVVLDEEPADWSALNDGITRAHRRTAEMDPVRRRVLEHPPGWVFLRREIDRGLVPAAEVATWSAAGCDLAEVSAWQASVAARPWGAEDERFYRGVLGGRTGGRYRLGADSAENVIAERDRYGAHCVIWHYLAPVLFAHTALTERRRPAGKTAVLRRHPDPHIRPLLEAAKTGYPDMTDPGVLLEQVTRLVDTLVPAPVIHPADHEGGPTRAELVSALGVLRCRITRYTYYLDPPGDVVTGYLVDREGKDLYAATAVLAAAAPQLGQEARHVITRFLNLVPDPPTSRSSLGEFLRWLRADKGLVNELLSLPLADPGSSR